MEFIIQKTVELGVTKIVPVASKRCVVKLDEKKARSKTERWRGIAEAAAKQSMRGIIPEIGEVLGFEESLKYAESLDMRLIPYELASDFGRTRDIIDSLKPDQSLAIFIGPEGGYAEEEIAAAEQSGVIPITLGRRILRTETAAMTVLSWLVYRLEP